MSTTTTPPLQIVQGALAAQAHARMVAAVPATFRCDYEYPTPFEILHFDTLTLEQKNDFLQKKLKEAMDEINSLKERLKNYTNPEQKKIYYQENREKILCKIKENRPKCKSCKLFPYYKKENLLCSYCDPNNKKIYGLKEMKVVNFLQSKNITFIHNKSVGFECGNYRPDVLIDCNTHFIVVEIDENQHESYNNNCEMARMNNIYIALGLPVVFLRYNPDKFFLNNIKIGIKENDRLNILFERINYYKEYVFNDIPIIIERLFYNNDNHIYFTKIDFEINI